MMYQLTYGHTLAWISKNELYTLFFLGGGQGGEWISELHLTIKDSRVELQLVELRSLHADVCNH